MKVKNCCLDEAGENADKIKRALNNLPETHYDALEKIIEHLIKYLNPNP